jgi:hydroxyethylthiazole kinase
MSETIQVGQWLQKVRSEKPLVHNITNLVVTNIAANALISIGASPVMAYAKEEVADMAKIASALALNMGTLDNRVVDAMQIAGESANREGVPIVFDPVGVGATPYRNQVAEKLTRDLKLSVLRGNAGEISVLLGSGGAVKGVDSAGASGQLPQVMQTYAREHGCVVIATGPVDYVADGESVWALENGHPLLAAITGSGCMATALLGAFVGVAGRNQSVPVYAEASIAALTCYNIAGELAAARANGPGTFQAELFDALYSLDAVYVQNHARIRRVDDVQ